MSLIRSVKTSKNRYHVNPSVENASRTGPPVPTKSRTKKVKASVGISMHKSSKIGNYRPTNEDVELYLLNMNYKMGKVEAINPNLAPVHVFVLCDGHGGDEVAKIVAPILLKQFSLKDNKYPLPNEQIFFIFETINKILKRDHKKNASECGSTVLVLIIYCIDGERAMQIVNLGDSRAVLSQGASCIPVTNDHRPDSDLETKRINAVNRTLPQNSRKYVMYNDGANRIGSLSVSRSLGDLKEQPQVTFFPDVFNIKITPETNFIILGCDGVWDTVDSESAVDFVKINREMFPQNNIAEMLADYSIASGSTDNVSVFVVFIKHFDLLV